MREFVYILVAGKILLFSFAGRMSVISKILSFLRSRLARNIYLWVFILFFVLGNSTYPYTYAKGWYYLFTAITTLLMMVLTYVNNLLLVPRVLAQKKYLLYLVLVFMHLCVISFIYTIVLKLAQEHFPILHVQQVSFMSSPVTTRWTLNDVSEEAFQYSIAFALWLFIFTMAWYMNDYSRQQKIANDAQKRQVETELNFLKSQINPHFLFNTLNNLYALALQKSDMAPDAILKLSSILRYLLYESNVPKIHFEKEKEIMHAYIDLELLRLSNKENLNFTITADRDYSIPPLLWLPVLENVFKHGTRIISDHYFIDYNFTISNNQLTIYSKNNRKFLNGKNHLEKAGGIGLDNTRKRLALLYPDKHSIKTTEGSDYFITEVQIDLDNEANKRIDSRR